MPKITYTVICPYDPSHKFPVVIDVKAGSPPGVESTFEEYCPFCDKYVSVTIEGKLEKDEELYRGLGF